MLPSTTPVRSQRKVQYPAGWVYLMFAKTERWEEMGAGKYGPMKGMMFRRLRFQGPRMEAMNNMGPFKSFLLLTGEIPGDTSVCPVSRAGMSGIRDYPPGYCAR